MRLPKLLPGLAPLALTLLAALAPAAPAGAWQLNFSDPTAFTAVASELGLSLTTATFTGPAGPITTGLAPTFSLDGIAFTMSGWPVLDADGHPTQDGKYYTASLTGTALSVRTAFSDTPILLSGLLSTALPGGGTYALAVQRGPGDNSGQTPYLGEISNAPLPLSLQNPPAVYGPGVLSIAAVTYAVNAPALPATAPGAVPEAPSGALLALGLLPAGALLAARRPRCFRTGFAAGEADPGGT